MKTSLVGFLILFLFAACSIDSTEREITTETLINNEVEEGIRPYIKRFQQEGALRGYDLSKALSEITAEITSIPETGVAGLCNYNSQRPNHVTIDKEYWNQSSDLIREFVVFHELGHCVLIRDHLEGCTRNRIYTSIMRSGLGSCRDAYNTENRTYYLDELFSITGDWELH